ncbi:MAG: 1-deoxy-D-xylulose-5-phosphate synthase [Succinivibrio sp.]|nr:1-deoxy-D-xylulose-5-phosphate synthase [Succinivibrio sp.]
MQQGGEGKTVVRDLLSTISSPEDLRKLPEGELPLLCEELRACLIDTVSKTAGHLASGLATVELAVAVHYVFDTPRDRLVWDVGHQAYPHKILTGHREELKTIRKKNGLHAFIWRGETPFDLLCTGHASTSIGSALGLAVAARDLGEKRNTIAVIGDGALTGGAAYEAMNNAGDLKDLNLLVILNDNEMSISHNVGAVARGLTTILTNPHYVKFMKGGVQVLKERLPAIHDLAVRAQEHVKGMVMPGTLFEELGFNYSGPVDGHDVLSLIGVLRNLKSYGGLQLLHVYTKKGKGYAPAEADPTGYHGVPVFDPDLGIRENPESSKTFSAGFGRWLCDRAASESRLMAITPAMREGSGMKEFSEKFPKQFFDVGIAEQHAMIFASGLAAGGMRPVVSMYSTFLQRAYDGVIHDFALQQLPIVLAVDRGGIVGPDGPSHQGVFDLAYLRTVPGIIVMTPSSLDEQYRMLNTAWALKSPCVVRYPRGAGRSSGVPIGIDETLEVGRARILCEGGGVAVAAFGPVALDLEKPCRERGFTLADMRFAKPLDYAFLDRVGRSCSLLMTVEDGARSGGLGEEIAAYFEEQGYSCRVEIAAVPDRFIMEDTREAILKELRLDAAGVIARIDECLKGALPSARAEGGSLAKPRILHKNRSK